MIKKNTLLHLRIPFSLFLMPFFLFAASQSEKPNLIYLGLSFIIIHLFFYPASNAYNSYFDKDEESIGGLENPPPVDKELFFTSLVFDLVALLLCFFISWEFSIMVLIIGMASKAYSHPSVRLKKFPVIGLLTVAFFQGGYTFLISFHAINETNIYDLFTLKNLWAAGLCSLMLFGSYPMTQVYQHNEDGKRGDKTMSRILGIEGTFIWTGIIFFFATGGFLLFFNFYYSINIAIIFSLFLFPTLIYFFGWFLRVKKNKAEANFKSTMRLNALSSLSFIAFFVFLFFYNRIQL
jgi:hypothetical protein